MVAMKRGQRKANLMTQPSEEEGFYKTQEEQRSGSDNGEQEGPPLCPQPWGPWREESEQPLSRRRSLQIKAGEFHRAQKCLRR